MNHSLGLLLHKGVKDKSILGQSNLSDYLGMRSAGFIGARFITKLNEIDKDIGRDKKN